MPTSPPSDSTNSLTGLRLSTRDFLDSSQERTSLLRSQSFLIPPTSLIPSTGEPRVPSPQLRTRDNADHAGLSPLLVPLRELCSSPLEPSNPTLSNNSLTAPSKTPVATVDSWTTLSNTLRPTHSSLRLSTHTLEDKDTAPTMPPRDKVRSRPSRMLE